jgi:NitT/TauT family transport system ATP-binding protein
MIALDLQAKRFGAEVVLGPMRLEVAAGEVLGVAGPSGVGKSTLLRILAGLDRDFEGRLSAPPRRAMVFQSPTLMPWRRVLANVTIPTGATAAAARALLERVGLRGLEDHYPGQISLGQARRVALARAFAAPARAMVARGEAAAVALSGGCFQNALLLRLMLRELEGLTVLAPRQVPANDGGLAFGQAVIAAAPHLAQAETA